MFYVSFFHIGICLFKTKIRYSGNFTESASTTFMHNGVTMTEYENEPFIVGDYLHNQIEFMHFSHKRWYTASPYPFQKYLFGYAAVARPGKVLILGGCCDMDWSTVSLFQNDKWSKIGNLLQGRMNHMAISYGQDIMLIGGKTKIGNK